MTYRFRKNWKGIAVAGLLVAAGGLLVCRWTPGCLLGPAAGSHTDITTVSARTAARVPAGRGIEQADEATFEQLVLGSDVPVLVDFYADWCAACQMLAPTLEQLAREMPEAKVVRVNVDQNPRLAAEYRISSIPSLLVFNDGRITAEHVGLAGKDQLRALLTR
jgi:thioredoxin 1